MSFSKKLLYGVLILEVQVILIALIFLIPKVLEVEQKVERTNKFLYTLLQDKKSASLQNIQADDIVIGDINAPATMYLYTKFNCSACAEFYASNYGKLQTEYVDKGLLKLVVRYLTHKDNEEAFYAARCAQYAYDNGVFSNYNELINSNADNLSLALINETVLNLLPDSTKFATYLNNESVATTLFEKAKKARTAGISRTPTIMINGQTLVGNRRYKKLEQMIQELL